MQTEKDSNGSLGSAASLDPQSPTTSLVTSLPFQGTSESEAPQAEEVGIPSKPLHLMSDEELRQRVQTLRANRLSQQTFAATLRREASEAKERKSGKKPSILDGYS